MKSSKDPHFYRKLAMIALPIAAQSLISSSLTLLDNLMVSRLGELPLAAVGLAIQSFNVEWLLLFGFCSGCATFYTQFWGVEDLKNIRKAMGLCFTACTAFGLIFFTISFCFPVKVLLIFTNSMDAALLGAQYLRIAAINFLLVAMTQSMSIALRATQQTRIPMFISIGAFFTDVIFNYLLIFGKFGFPRMEIRGAALATVFARVLELGLTLFVIFGRNNVLRGKLKEYFAFDWRFAKRIFQNAAATTANETLWSMAVAAQNAAYGRIGVTEFAAVQASTTAMDLFQMACFSLGDAALILIGEQLGRCELEKAKEMSKKLLKTCMVCGLVTAALIMTFSRSIVSIFELSEIGAGYAERIIIIKALAWPVSLIDALLVCGICRAGGDAPFAALVEIISMWCYTVPAAFICALAFKLPVYWVVLFVQFELLIKFVILFRRYRSGKWIKNMIDGM